MCVCVCVCVWLTNVDIRYLKKNEIKINRKGSSADSHCYAAETNTTLQSNYPPIKNKFRDLSSCPVFKPSPSNAEGAGSIPGWGPKIPRDSWPKNPNRQQKQYHNKFNRGLKEWS